VWDSSLERPGCAFTRSFGDAVAEACGVNAVPEVLVWNLSPADKYIIIASDGVFEFLTSQAVVDIISKFESCLEAAKYVVAESYRLWLTYDDRTDDISMIIIEVSNMKPKHHGGMGSKDGSARFGSTIADSNTSKPVRRVMSKQKRMVIAETWDREETELFNIEANLTAKSAEEIERIEKMVDANFMFQHLSQQQRDLIFKVMKLRRVIAGEVIIKEGDPGDEMYIVDRGVFDVFKKDDSGVSQLVFTYNTSGSAFGELSLMYGKKRAATVKAVTDGALWTIGRQAFRAVLMRRKQKGLLKLLKTVPVVGTLPFPKLQRLCELATDEVYAGKELISGANKPNQWMVCIVKTGSLQLLPSDKSKAAQFRGEGTFMARLEVDDGTFSEVQAHGKTVIACFSMDAIREVAGMSAEAQLASAVAEMRWKNQAAHIRREKSIFSNSEKQKLSRIATRSDIVLDNPILPIGEYGYLGNFYHKSGKLCSVKVVAKKLAAVNKMDSRLLQERQFLAALQGSSNCVAKVVSTFQDEKLAFLMYEDVFTCDLAAAMAADALTAPAKVYYAACIYSALHALHNHGVMHRFINPEGIYITVKGVPKLADLRYAKRMDGSQSFTICGDPLFFAPEIIRQQGMKRNQLIFYFYSCSYSPQCISLATFITVVAIENPLQ
jgi:serine/threonine protein kinase